jgi:large subunit ribosomal protein L35
MPKNKIHKGLTKRIRISKSGKVKHRSANRKHLRSGKGGKRLRRLRKSPFMANPDAKRLEKLLFRRLRGRTQPRTALRKSPSPAERRAAKEAAAATATKAPTSPAKSAPKSAPAKTAKK